MKFLSYQGINNPFIYSHTTYISSHNTNTLTTYTTRNRTHNIHITPLKTQNRIIHIKHNPTHKIYSMHEHKRIIKHNIHAQTHST